MSGDDPDRPRYSVTSLMIYEACPLQYYYAYIRGVPPPRSRAMERGVSIHKIIADELKRPTLLPPDIEPDMQHMLETFKNSRFNVSPMMSERPFVLSLGQGEVRGRIDLVLSRGGGGLEVVDFKSGTTRSRDEMAGSIQLPLYTLAAGRLYDKPAQDMAYTYYFLRDDVELSFTPQNDDFERLSRRVEGLMQAIGEERFQPAPGCTCYACRIQRRRGTRGRADL